MTTIIGRSTRLAEYHQATSPLVLLGNLQRQWARSWKPDIGDPSPFVYCFRLLEQEARVKDIKGNNSDKAHPTWIDN